MCIPYKCLFNGGFQTILPNGIKLERKHDLEGHLDSYYTVYMESKK